MPSDVINWNPFTLLALDPAFTNIPVALFFREFSQGAIAPVQDQALIGFGQEDPGAARAIENNFVVLFQAVQAIPAQDFAQHESHDEVRRIDGNCRVFDEELVDMADKLNRQVRE